MEMQIYGTLLDTISEISPSKLQGLVIWIVHPQSRLNSFIIWIQICTLVNLAQVVPLLNVIMIDSKGLPANLFNFTSLCFDLASICLNEIEQIRTHSLFW